jgi:hypothetical protein
LTIWSKMRVEQRGIETRHSWLQGFTIKREIQYCRSTEAGSLLCSLSNITTIRILILDSAHVVKFRKYMRLWDTKEKQCRNTYATMVFLKCCLHNSQLQGNGVVHHRDRNNIVFERSVVSCELQWVTPGADLGKFRRYCSSTNIMYTLCSPKSCFSNLAFPARKCVFPGFPGTGKQGLEQTEKQGFDYYD